MVVASFHLVRFPRRLVPAAIAHVPIDRWRMSRVDGCRFHKVLGTGAGTTMSASADLTRWALFAVWDDRASLDRFVASHPISTRWWGRAIEAYHLRLQPLGAHGAWGGRDPLGEAVGADDREGPVAVLTRATIRTRRLRAFLAAVGPVDALLASTPGLLATIGVGEAPLLRQATVSLWDSADAVQTFAYRHATHADVIRRTRDEDWYAEEWFARFRPEHLSGTWDGVDPLAVHR